MGKRDSHKDDNFGEKLNHLAGILGHRYSSTKFVHKNLAAELGMHNSQLSHMLKGGRGVSEEVLAKLIAAFGLHHHGITYEDFSLNLDAFKKKMCTKNVGLHGDMAIEQARQLLTTKTIEEAKISNGLRIQVNRIEPDCHRRGGGIGSDEEPPNELPKFKVGDLAVVQIHNLKLGHLIVLNDQLGVDITVLMPSMAAPGFVVQRPGTLTLPNAGDMHAFPVGAPQTPHTAEPVLYRLYAVWSPTPFSMTHLLENLPEDRLIQWSYFDLASLLSDLNGRGEKLWRAASLDYFTTLT